MYTRVVGWAGPAVPCSPCRGSRLHRYRGKGQYNQPTDVRPGERPGPPFWDLSARAGSVEAWTRSRSCASWADHVCGSSSLACMYM